MPHSPRTIDRIVDEQVQRWQVERARTAQHVAPRPPVIAISRQFGARGAAVGHVVADRLGYKYWNRALVDEIMRHAHVSDRQARAFDERHEPGVVESVRAMVNNGPLSATEFFRELERVVRDVASHGAAVLVGRGVGFMLDPGSTLRVRVVCPLAQRIARIRERDGVTEAEARAEIHSIDLERSQFVRDHYGHDADDPAGYDLHVNTGTMPLDAAADVVIAACRARFGELAEAARI